MCRHTALQEDLWEHIMYYIFLPEGTMCIQVSFTYIFYGWPIIQKSQPLPGPIDAGLTGPKLRLAVFCG